MSFGYIIIFYGQCSIFREEEIFVTDSNRQYWIHVPDNVEIQKDIPVIFFFHGIGDNPSKVLGRESTYRISEFAKQNKSIIVLPNSGTPPCKDVVILGIKILSCYDSPKKRWDIANIMNGVKVDPLQIRRSRCSSPDITFMNTLASHIRRLYPNVGKMSAIGHSFGAIFGFYLSQCTEWYGIFYPIHPNYSEKQTESKGNGNGTNILIIHDDKDECYEQVSYGKSVELYQALMKQKQENANNTDDDESGATATTIDESCAASSANSKTTSTSRENHDPSAVTVAEVKMVRISKEFDEEAIKRCRPHDWDPRLSQTVFDFVLGKHDEITIPAPHLANNPPSTGGQQLEDGHRGGVNKVKDDENAGMEYFQVVGPVEMDVEGYVMKRGLNDFFEMVAFPMMWNVFLVVGMFVCIRLLWRRVFGKKKMKKKEN